MSYRIGVDIGGTFTDFALLDGEQILLEKVLSTPADRSLAVMNGLEKLAERCNRSLADFLGEVVAIIHGTTVADNTLIEMNGATTGLLTTEGFRDELEFRRGYKEDIWDVRLEPPPAIVPRRRRLTVKERVLFDGRIHQTLDEESARAAARRLALQGVDSVAICTLFSFVNPIHELRLAEIVAEELPDATISLSHRVMPKAPEFERTSTTVVNAYIGPKVTAYLDRLSERLKSAGYRRDFLVMQSSGGVMTREYLRETPVRVLASGPAGGVIGGAQIGVAKDAKDLLCVDMGGTSYDVSVVRNGQAPAQPGWNWHHRYVVGLPMVSVETLGAGGGSICRVDNGVLSVGPESAGADPGPVCYGIGGTLPTITDANLILGLLSADSEFAGGSFSLSQSGVAEAFKEHVAGPLGCEVEQAAFDCWRVVNANMTQAVRRLTAEKGTDPRGLSMLAYGGNGPLFAAIQAQELGIDRVLIPKASPTFSALGALAAQPTIDEERSYLVASSQADATRLGALWDDLVTHADRHFADGGFDMAQRTALYQINLRYPGQNWSLTVDVGRVDGVGRAKFVDDDLAQRAAKEFHALHEREYGHTRLEEEPEITGVRLVTTVASPAPAFGSAASTATPVSPARASVRRANLGRGFEEVPVYRGPDLEPGSVIESPAIIEESFTTIVVYPGWRAHIDDAGDYELNRKN
jgi:N-methylhydantoinase A